MNHPGPQVGKLGIDDGNNMELYPACVQNIFCTTIQGKQNVMTEQSVPYVAVAKL